MLACPRCLRDGNLELVERHVNEHPSVVFEKFTHQMHDWELQWESLQWCVCRFGVVRCWVERNIFPVATQSMVQVQFKGSDVFVHRLCLRPTCGCEVDLPSCYTWQLKVVRSCCQPLRTCYTSKPRWLLTRGSQKHLQCYFGQSPNDVVGDMRPDENAIMECRQILDSSKEGIPQFLGLTFTFYRVWYSRMVDLNSSSPSDT